jgi:UDP-glucuronate 4-epimerase
MKILVTGAAGFVGCETCLALLSRGDEVIGLDNINSYYSVELKYARLSRLGIAKEDIRDNVLTKGIPNFRFVKVSLEDSANIATLFRSEKFDRVIHLAAQAGVRYSIENPSSYIQSNMVGFGNILEGCRHNQVQHLVYASSSSVYGMNTKIPFSTNDSVDHPVSLYAVTKKTNELMAHSYSHLYKIPTTGLRYFTVYGPWGRPDMAPMLFSDAITSNRPIKIFNNGNMKRDFTFIEDIVRGTIQALDQEPHKNPHRKKVEAGSEYYCLYNIGRGKPVDLMEFVTLLENKLGVKSEKLMMPMQSGDVQQTWADTTALEEEIGYKPRVSLEDGIGLFTEWYKSSLTPS